MLDAGSGLPYAHTSSPLTSLTVVIQAVRLIFEYRVLDTHGFLCPPRRKINWLEPGLLLRPAITFLSLLFICFASHLPRTIPIRCYFSTSRLQFANWKRKETQNQMTTLRTETGRENTCNGKWNLLLYQTHLHLIICILCPVDFICIMKHYN